MEEKRHVRGTPSAPEVEVGGPGVLGCIERWFAFADSPVRATGLVAFDVALVVFFDCASVWHSGGEGGVTLVALGAAIVASKAFPIKRRAFFGTHGFSWD